MRKTPFYILIAVLAIGIIVLNTNDSVKYLTCEDPNNYTAVVEEMDSSEVVITFDTISSSETFSDYVYHIEQGTLYIGVKYTMNPLSDDAISKYTATIELTEEVSQIVLRGGTIEEIVYP